MSKRAYARQAKNRELEVDAAEIRMRAERRLGELIRAQKETVGLATGGGDTSGGSRKAPPQEPPSLADAGIDKKLSSRAQKLAAPVCTRPSKLRVPARVRRSGCRRFLEAESGVGPAAGALEGEVFLDHGSAKRGAGV